MRVAIPAMFDIPEPRLVPHNDHTKDEAVRVVDASPAVLGEFNYSRRFILSLAASPPSLNLSL